jgi:hypothetical protein
MENFWEMRFFERPFWDCYESRVKNIASMCRKRLTEKKCWQNPGFRCWTFRGCSPPFHYMVHFSVIWFIFPSYGSFFRRTVSFLRRAVHFCVRWFISASYGTI